MSFLKNLFGNNESDGEDEQILNWVLSVLKIIEKANTELYFFECDVQVVYGNNVEIRLVEEYDGMLPKCGAKYGLDKLFNFTPNEMNIYISRITPHIVGNRRQFLNRLERLLKENQITGYKRDDKLDVLEKRFDN